MNYFAKMKVINKMIKALTIFLSLFVVLFQINFLTPQSTFAQTTSNTQPVTIEVNNPKAENGKITAVLQINNPNSASFGDAYYTVKILSQEKTQIETKNGKETTIILPGELITYKTSEKFVLKESGSQNVDLNFDFGSNLSTGQYDVQIALFSATDSLLGSKTITIDLTGTGNNIQINKCVLVVNNIEYAPTIGPNVEPKGEIYAKCNVTNPSQNTLNVNSVTEYAVNSVANANNKQEFSPNSSITIEGGATKDIFISLPALETPQVYEGMTYLKDNQGSPVSAKVVFRWVVAGASSQIRSLTSDKESYKKGETAKVIIGADPSLDLFWKGGGPTKAVGQPSASQSASFAQPKLQGTPLQNPVIEIIIKDGNGKECGKAEKKVEGVKADQNTWPDQTLDVPISKNCENITVEAKVKNDGQVLASKELNYKKNAGETGISNMNRIIIGLIIIILVIAGAGAALWFIKKKNKKIPPPVTAALMLFIIGSLFLSGKIDLKDGFSFVSPAFAANQSIEVGTNEIVAYRPGQPCPGPNWFNQPQGSDGQGGCLLGIVSSYSWTTWHNLDTSNEITFGTDGKIRAHIAGQFTGRGCVNAQVGLIVRAYINGSQDGVSINGAGPRVEYQNLAAYGGGNGSPVDKNITIASTVNKCGPLDVRIEVIPFIDHAGRIASDKAEDRLLTEADVPGWKNITYMNRANCGGGGSCWATLQKQVDAGPCVQCGAECTNASDCAYAANGCSACLPKPGGVGGKTCQPPINCGHACASNLDCVDAINGCNSCLPNLNGQGSSCQTQPKCGTPCLNPASCEGAQNGCTSCINDGNGAKCGKCPAGMNYDPAAQKCVCPNPGETNPHKVCDGDKCLDVNSCGVTTCSQDKQCFAEEMCKCDGFDAVTLEYPSAKPFVFDAFAKVEGTDISKAIVEGIQFKMSESDKSNPNVGTIIAQSQVFPPQIVSQDASKVRYKATWSLTPPQVKANKTYRVFSEIKCKPKNKRRVANAADLNQFQSKVAGIATANAQENSGGIELAAEDDLQLRTLNLIKKKETDMCRFLIFEYNEGL
jgi:hypothetical protein